ncbi:DUF3072 domain-containing protein [Nocardioides zhouii]|uniref:DUF3072 domain-containing protein n=1 Tax=Nocardioides zhouii TaxID=1168729 RepID=A0A4Q2T4F6_9ACTN|nr:DUF3072 domain-containing protein [Nocardioides zhouii]RYC13665.1 DUF3072 domain-containing protein [Nocardioides zhouii]
MTESNTYSDGATQPTGEVLGGPQADSTRKDPQEWATGDEPMTGAQRSYLDTLAREAGEEISADLTKAEASEHIDRLQSRSDRVPTDS